MAGRARPGRGLRPHVPDVPPGQPGPSSGAAPVRLNRFGLPVDFDMGDLLGPNSDALIANMRLPKSLTRGRGFVKVVPVPVQEKPETGIDYADRVSRQFEENAIKKRKTRNEADAESQQMDDEAVGDRGAAAGNQADEMEHTNLDAVSTAMASEKVNLINFSTFNLARNTGPAAVAAKVLPIESHRQEILKAVRMNQVTVIEGTTGCGKTTRVPVFLMEDMVEQKEQFHIVVTQPRRIAAVSVAKRVASSCGCELGATVGYQIGMDRNFVGEDTHLLYCTTGVLLQKVISFKKDGQLHLPYTHIVIDEIHERNVDTDLLLMILRKYIWEQDTSLKLILMSATLQTERFITYFQLKTQDPALSQLTPNLVKIQQKPQSLSTFYLEEFVGKFDLPKRTEFQLDDPQLHPDLYDVCIGIIRHMSQIESQNKRGRGAVLIFLPGLNEITDLRQRLKAENEKDERNKFWILPLHSSITDEEQRLVFERPFPGHRKVILSTNIAESSITVPDIEYVIDFCLTKNLVVDKKTNLPTLTLQWATQSSCKQRAGRAGRTMAGRAYNLVYSTFHRSFEKYPKPEILNIPLENCVLSAKSLDMGSPKELLALCLDPPKIEDIRAAVMKLKRAGGLSVFNENNSFDPEDGILTAVGRVMRALPIDINLSKLIVLGYVFGLVEEAVIMAACLTVNSMFARRFGEELNSYKCRLTWSDRSFCDLISYYNAFLTYKQFCSFSPSNEQMNNWAKSNFIQLKRISEVEETAHEIERRLDSIKMSREKPPNLTIGAVDRELLLKFMIAGAFYPNYFMRQKLEPTLLAKAMPGHNPHSSVILSGFPANQGVLYAKQVRDLMRPASDVVDLEFEDTKAIVTFSGEKNPLADCIKAQNRFFRNESQESESKELLALRETAIKSSVYVAVKMRKLSHNYPLTIRLMNADEARQTVTDLSEIRDRKFEEARLLRTGRFRVPAFNLSDITKPVMPQSNDFEIAITWMEECAHFYAKYFNEESMRTGQQISDAVAAYHGPRIVTPQCGMLVLAATQHNRAIEYQRAVVVDINHDERKVQVQKVDIGGKEWVALDNVIGVHLQSADPRLLLPAQAFECRLAEIKPSSFRNIHGVWEPEANDFFDDIIAKNNGRFHASLFSIMDGVFRVHLMTSTGSRELVSEMLLEAGWAESLDESVESQHQNRTRREMAGQLENMMQDVSQMYEVDPKSLQLQVSRKIANLKGPNSPLECTFTGVTCNQFSSGISIDQRSVNSVALESEPECEFQRMLVAAQSTFSSESKKIVARETCMLPVIPGLPALIVMTFAPVCELRCDPSHQLFVGSLCGLGAQQVQGHMFAFDEANDIEVTFDVLMTRRDVADINSIRYRISSMLSDQQTGRFDFTGTPLFSRQKKVRDEILALIQRRRMRLPPVSSVHFNFKWGLTPKSLISNPDLKVRNLFLRMIAVPNITDFIEKATMELDGFRQLTIQNFGLKSVVCPLDGLTIRNAHDLETHLLSKDHKNRVTEMRIQRLDKDQAELLLNRKAPHNGVHGDSASDLSSSHKNSLSGEEEVPMDML